jgi:hypothetical protein
VQRRLRRRRHHSRRAGRATGARSRTGLRACARLCARLCACVRVRRHECPQGVALRGLVDQANRREALGTGRQVVVDDQQARPRVSQDPADLVVGQAKIDRQPTPIRLAASKLDEG